MRFGILKKFLIAFLLVSLVPLIVLSFFARDKVNQVGRSAMESSRDALVKNAASLLEARARAIASQVELFLHNTCEDLKTLAAFPPDAGVYRNFSEIHQRKIWLRAGTPENPYEQRVFYPLYREITYADADGQEKIRITGDRIQPGVRDVSTAFTSRYGVEDYFRQARGLPPGTLYVSRLMGRHVRKTEQLRGEPDVERAVGGREFEGLIRFAMPLYAKTRVQGVVSIGLDHRHLMSYTQHVQPTGSQEIVFPSYSSGNYAFLFDDQGWIITHPKFWDIRGWDQDTGKLINPLSAAYNEASLKNGSVPFNLLHVPFIHTNYRRIALDVLAGRPGVTRTSSVGRVDRVMAYAPIRFSQGAYTETGYFGGVTLGARTDTFYKVVEETSARIAASQGRTVEQFVLIIALAGFVVAIISVLLARSFTRPIQILAGKVKEVKSGHYDIEVNITSKDELEVLGNDFQSMGHQLKKNEENLVTSLRALAKSKTEIEKYNRQLEKQVDILKNIQSVGHSLSLTFDRAEVLDIILKNCVDGLGFDRALIYLFNPETQKLKCARAYGFKEEIAALLAGAAYDIRHHNCLQIRVFTSRQPILVKDVDADPQLTDLDRRIARESKTTSFVYTPVYVSDRNIGVLGADYAASQRQIAETQMESLKIIANEAAMALERTRLMSDIISERDFVESIFANMMSGLLVVDHNGVICSANRNAEQFFKFNGTKIVGQQADRVLSAFPDFLLFVKRAIDSLEESPGTEIEVTLPEGQKVFVEVVVSAFQRTDDPGEKSSLVIFRDVTKRKKMEKHLSRSDRLVSLGTLAAGVAHEIRNPLTGISLLLDDLHDRMADRPDERLMMQSALAEIEKLEKIITEMLEFAAKPTSRPVPKDLNRVIDNSLFFIQKQCKQQGVRLVHEKPAELPPVDLDPEKIKQAIYNIILNSLAVLPKGGSIHIAAQPVTDLAFFKGGRGVELTIRDDGPGINPDDLNFIFDPFFTRNPKGSGLGLSITHTIIEEHDGKIAVESEAGQGATFKIYLPLSRATTDPNGRVVQ